MIRLGAALLAAALLALWFAMPDAEARRRHHRGKRTAPAALAIDVGPKVVRTIKIDPCEVARTFAEVWRCRAP